MGVLPYQEVGGGGGGGLAPKVASEIFVGAPNFASKNIGHEYPEFCPLNFRFDPDCVIIRFSECCITSQIDDYVETFSLFSR